VAAGEIGGRAGSHRRDWCPATCCSSATATERITHVGSRWAAARMVHLALGRGGYAVERLDAHDDAYVTLHS
jgi:hypothetical protein